MKLGFLSLVLGVLVPALLAPTLPAPPIAQDEEAPFVLGVLRRDGVVIPFASFGGKNWESRWPDELRWTDLPITLGDVPPRWWGKAGPPSSLTIWAEGTARGSIHLDRPVMITPACERRIGVTSDYRSTEIPPPPSVRPYPKEGLVTSGPEPIVLPLRVSQGNAEWVAATKVLAGPMDAAEQSAINQFTDWKHPVKRDDRKKIPIEIEALYRAPMDAEGWTAYHVEVIKRYPPGPKDEGCGLVTSATGWVAIGPKGKHWTQLYARITYCDRKGVAYFLPLGLMNLRGRRYWIFQASGYDSEGYAIVRPTSKAIEPVVSYTAGRCGGF